MGAPRNMTGLYLSGFIQEGYLPPQERKSTIPSTFYRGHVVKLARAPNTNPHRSSVGRYPMHSLNSGFNGLKVPIKDQMNFKNPEKIKRPLKSQTKGKWANYPMSIEIRKIAGSGASGSYLAECVLGGDQASLEEAERNAQLPRSRIGSSLFAASPVNRDKDEEMFYRSMYDEIRQVVSHQEDAMVISRRKLQRILLNNSDNRIRPDVLTPAREPKRVSTSYGYLSKSPIHVTPPAMKRPHTTAVTVRDKKQSSLLLPVPYVSSYAWTQKQSSEYSAEHLGSFSPWLPRVPPALPHSRKTQTDEHSYNSNVHRRIRPEFAFYYPRPQTNIGVTSAERLNRLLSTATEDIKTGERKAEQSDETELEKEIMSVADGLNEVSEDNLPPNPSLSVVVPVLGEETPSLTCSPLPPRLETPPTDRTLVESLASDQHQSPKLVVSPKVTNVQLFSENEGLEER